MSRRSWRAPLLAVLPLLLALSAVVATQAPAKATITVDTFAGTGTAGFSGDGGAATNAQLNQPMGVAADDIGNVYIMDNYNNRIRKVNTGGVISTYSGDGTFCQSTGLTNSFGPDDLGICGSSYNPGLMGGTGSYLYFRNAGWFDRVASGGAKYHVAGTLNRPCSQDADGDAFATCMFPNTGAVGSGGLYYASGATIKKWDMATAGTISTVAGNGNPNCNSPANDNDLAVGACIHVSYPVAWGNSIYFFDSMSASGPRIFRIDMGESPLRLHKIAGSGSWSDYWAADHSAVNSGIGSVGPLAVSSTGEVYLGATGHGIIRRVDTTGHMWDFVNVGAAESAMAFGPDDTLYVSVPSQNKVKKVAVSNSAAVSNIAASVTPSTPLYKMRVTFNVSGETCPATAHASIGSSSIVTKTLCNVGGTPPTSGNVDVPVTSLNPETSYTAKVSVSDGSGTSTAGTATVTTPKAPVWVGVGDSYSAGHHQDQDQPCNHNGTLDDQSFEYALAAYALNGTWGGTCLDPKGSGASSFTPNDTDFSWVTRARDQLMSQLNIPTSSPWRMVVLVLARSGALAANYTKPGPTDDSTCNGCGEKDEMVSALQARAGSWNIVSLNGGANDALMPDRFSEFYANTEGNGQPWATIDRTQCVNTDQLDGDVWATRDSTQQALTAVLNAADDTDPNVRRVLLTYPYVLNTDSASSVCGDDSTTSYPHIGGFHTIDDMDNTITGVSVSGVTTVDLRSAPGFASNPLNDIQQTRYFGYPHPNSAGQNEIASAVVNTLLS